MARRNTDEDVQGLRKRLAKDPENEQLLRSISSALLRLKDHRALVELGARVVPILREAEEAMPPREPSVVTDPPLARKARVDIVRLELSILGSGAWIAASPFGTSEPPSYWISSGQVRQNHSGQECVSAFPPGGGSGLLIPLTDIVRIGADARRAREEAIGPWRLAKLTFDGALLGDAPIEAWLRGDEFNGVDTWNGWAQPHMTLAQLRRFVELWNKESDGSPFSLSIRDRGAEPPALVVLYDETQGEGEPDVIESEILRGPGAPSEPMWSTGLGLIWTEEQPDQS
jgi:hypothetical protein